MSDKLFGIDLSKSAESQFEKQPDFDLQNNISEENSLRSDKSKNGKIQPTHSVTETFIDESVKEQKVKEKNMESDRDLADENIVSAKSSLDDFNF